jgi:phage host-nuclease inhibitor protein Gam
MPTKTRIKVTPTAIPIVTREQAESLINDIALTVANKRRISADLDEQLLAIKEKYKPQLDECDAVIKANSELVQIWADANPEEFAKRKSIAFPAGTVGYRTGTPALRLLNKQWSWERVLEAVQRILPSFVRTKPEVDKEAILNQRDELQEFLPMVGLKVAQAETFFIEPDLTALETRIS